MIPAPSNAKGKMQNAKPPTPGSHLHFEFCILNYSVSAE